MILMNLLLLIYYAPSPFPSTSKDTVQNMFSCLLLGNREKNPVQSLLTQNFHFLPIVLLSFATAYFH